MAKQPKPKIEQPEPEAVSERAVPRGKGRPSTSEKSVGPEALIDLACELMTRVPPSEITRISLGHHANVHPTLIRYHFKNRDNLVRTATETLTRRLQARGDASEKPGLSPVERICSRARALLEFKFENPFYHRLMMEEMAQSVDPKSRQLYQDISSGAIERYRRYIKEGVSDGSLKDVDPAFLYASIVGMCDYIVIASPVLPHFAKIKNKKKLIKQYGDYMCDLIVKGLQA